MRRQIYFVFIVYRPIVIIQYGMELEEMFMKFLGLKHIVT